MANDIVALLKQLGIICREPVNLKNAGASDFYVDVKKAYGYPDVLNQIADALWEKIDKDVTCIATAGYGGLSPATVIASKHNVHLTLVRDKPKKHGKWGWIDGYVPNEQDRVAIVDDVFTTGESLREIIRVLQQLTKVKIVGCYVVCKRGEGKVEIPVTYILTPEELL